MKARKATRGQLRRNNRQLLLRAVYTRLANSRADLAHESGLAKPTVSDLIGELITEGYLAETGLGQSTDEGGKRPRLIEFVPDARHVIGLSVTPDRVLGVLANLDGRVLVQHAKPLDGARGQAVIDALYEVINGLLAQLSAPLLCIGVGVPALVDVRDGVIHDAPRLGWHDVQLAAILNTAFCVPVYIANSTELAALALFAFSETDEANSLVTVLIEDGVGVGAVLDGAAYHSGSEISSLRTPSGAHLETFLGWAHVQERAASFRAEYVRALGIGDEFSYLHLRQAVADGHPAAVALHEDLAESLAQVFAWVLLLLRPEHIALAGTMADLGPKLLERTIAKTRALIQPDLLDTLTVSVDSSPSLVALGAVAQTLQHELGLIG